MSHSHSINEKSDNEVTEKIKKIREARYKIYALIKQATSDAKDFKNADFLFNEIQRLDGLLEKLEQKNPDLNTIPIRSISTASEPAYKSRAEFFDLARQENNRGDAERVSQYVDEIIKLDNQFFLSQVSNDEKINMNHPYFSDTKEIPIEDIRRQAVEAWQNKEYENAYLFSKQGADRADNQCLFRLAFVHQELCLHQPGYFSRTNTAEILRVKYGLSLVNAATIYRTIVLSKPDEEVDARLFGHPTLHQSAMLGLYDLARKIAYGMNGYAHNPGNYIKLSNGAVSIVCYYFECSLDKTNTICRAILNDAIPRHPLKFVDFIQENPDYWVIIKPGLDKKTLQKIAPYVLNVTNVKKIHADLESSLGNVKALALLTAEYLNNADFIKTVQDSHEKTFYEKMSVFFSRNNNKDNQSDQKISNRNLKPK